MKSKKFRVFKIIMICLCSCLIFVSTGYFYLNKSLKQTENSASDIPYASAVPENAGLLLNICDSRTFFYLDFEKSNLTVIVPEEDVDLSADYILGYPVNYQIEADYIFLAEVIDLIDGIEMVQDGENLRFTGVQISDMLSRSEQNSELKRNVLTQVISKIGKNGFEKSNFVYIIENSKTNLTVPDCYFWSDYLKELCKSGRIIN